MKKEYIIKIDRVAMDRVKRELEGWNIPREKYSINDNLIITSSCDVVDVITESLNCCLYNITERGNL